MKLTRTLFIALAFLVPASWTIAKAGDEGGKEEKKEKKGKKGKKADGEKKEEEKKM